MRDSTRDRGATRHEPGGAPDVTSRRKVLKWSSAGVLAALAYGAKVPELGLQEALAQRGASAAVDLGGGDIGVLNYAYALEQLEAAFYTQVVATPYAGMTPYEQQVMVDLRNHEIAHREFFKKALGRNRIPDLVPNFSAINFGSRSSVITTAKTFEDLGVSAYNGAGQLLQSPKFLAAAGTIVSVEARHAAIIRDITNSLSEAFAGPDVVDFNGLDVARLPSQVLPLAAPFIATPVTARQLP